MVNLIRMKLTYWLAIVICCTAALITVGSAQADDTAALIKQLGDSNPVVRRDAAIQLRELRDPGTIGPLIDALKDQDPEVCGCAAQALEAIGEPAILPLIAVIRTADDRVARGATQALGEISAYRPNRPKVRLAGGVEVLTSALKRPDAGVRHAAAEALGYVGDARAVDPLIAALKDESWEVRQDAASGLGKIKDLRALNGLIGVLDDKEESVVISTATALGEIGNDSAAKPLLDALRNRSQELELCSLLHPMPGGYRVATCAVDALLKLKGQNVLDALITGLDDSKPSCRYYAALVLAEKDDSKANEKLNSTISRGDLVAVAGAFRYFIRKGDAASEGPLAEALNRYGDASMAEDFSLCGNQRLRQAAEQWKANHSATPVRSMPVKMPDSLRWGVRA